ncbi:MAG TPA: GNAT family N-acetyltransferase [bacterium]|nr:GNAT family N-acetyltransferase [bacterium]
MAELRLKILEGIADVPKEAWNALLEPGAPPFARWEWIEALESSGSATRRTGWEPHHLTLWRGRELVGHAPAWRKFHSMGEYVYDFAWASAAAELGVNYYPKLLVGVPLSPITARRFSFAPNEGEARVRETMLEGATAAARESECSSVHVIFPPEGEALALESLGLAHRVGMQYHWTNPGYATYDDYLARFSSKRRHQLRRERGEAAKQGITVRTVTRPELGEPHAELAWRIYEATNKKNAWGRVQLTRAFFHKVFEVIPEVELVVAEKDGRPVAAAFNVGTAERLYGRYWGALQEFPFLHFHVCLYHSIDDCIRRGRKVFEPGAGGEHKIPRGFAPTAIHSAHRIFDPRLDHAIRDFVRREAKALQEYLRNAEEVAGMKPWIGMDEE